MDRRENTPKENCKYRTMKDSIRKIYYPLKDYLLICLGTAMYGFGFNGFILSNQVVTGGLSGIGALI